MSNRFKVGIAVSIVVVLAGGLAAWLLLVSPRLNPMTMVEQLGVVVKADESSRLTRLVSDRLSEEVDGRAGQSLIDVLDSAGIADAHGGRVTDRGSKKAVYSYSSDAGDTELLLIRDGMGWVLDEVVLTKLEETSVVVEAEDKYIETKYLAEGVTSKKNQGSPGKADVVNREEVVNGIAGPKTQVEERVTVEAVASEYWRGIGPKSPYADRLSDLRAGDSYNASTHRIEDAKQKIPRDADLFAIGFHAEPIDSSMKFHVVFLKPQGDPFIDDPAYPDSGWTYFDVVDYITDSYTDIMPGYWTAAIMIDDRPAGFVAFQIR